MLQVFLINFQRGFSLTCRLGTNLLRENGGGACSPPVAGCIEHCAPESQKSGMIFSLFIPCTDDLANKVKLANNYSTPLLLKVPEADQVLDGRITLGFLV